VQFVSGGDIHAKPSIDGFTFGVYDADKWIILNLAFRFQYVQGEGRRKRFLEPGLRFTLLKHRLELQQVGWKRNAEQHYFYV